jgi:hypothetical protein
MLAIGAGWALTRGPWAMGVAGGLAYYLAGVIQAHLAAQAIRPFISVADEDYQRVARVNVWGWPVVSLASWLGIAAAGLSRTIVWRGIVYRMDSPQQTTILTNRAGLKDEGNAHARTTTRAA